VLIVLTGLIGLVPLDPDPQTGSFSRLMVLLLKTTSESHDGSSPVVATHVPEIRFNTKTMRDAKPVSIEANWEIDQEDFSVETTGDSQLVVQTSDLEKFADSAQADMGIPVVEEIFRDCVEVHVGSRCREGLVGRFIVTAGTVKAVELGNTPTSLTLAPDDLGLWSFRSTRNPELVSSKLFQFASAVLVDLGTIDIENVSLKVDPWPGRLAFRNPASSFAPPFSLGLASSADCKSLTTKPDPCVIVHVLNVIPSPSLADSADAPMSSPDEHQRFFSRILERDGGELLLPYRKLFVRKASDGSGSSPSGRCVPRVLHVSQ